MSLQQKSQEKKNEGIAITTATTPLDPLRVVPSDQVPNHYALLVRLAEDSNKEVQEPNETSKSEQQEQQQQTQNIEDHVQGQEKPAAATCWTEQQNENRLLAAGARLEASPTLALEKVIQQQGLALPEEKFPNSKIDEFSLLSRSLKSSEIVESMIPARPKLQGHEVEVHDQPQNEIIKYLSTTYPKFPQVPSTMDAMDDVGLFKHYPTVEQQQEGNRKGFMPSCWSNAMEQHDFRGQQVSTFACDNLNDLSLDSTVNLLEDGNDSVPDPSEQHEFRFSDNSAVISSSDISESSSSEQHDYLQVLETLEAFIVLVERRESVDSFWLPLVEESSNHADDLVTCGATNASEDMVVQQIWSAFTAGLGALDGCNDRPATEPSLPDQVTEEPLPSRVTNLHAVQGQSNPVTALSTTSEATLANECQETISTGNILLYCDRKPTKQAKETTGREDRSDMSEAGQAKYKRKAHTVEPLVESSANVATPKKKSRSTNRLAVSSFLGRLGGFDGKTVCPKGCENDKVDLGKNRLTSGGGSIPLSVNITSHESCKDSESESNATEFVIRQENSIIKTTKVISPVPNAVHLETANTTTSDGKVSARKPSCISTLQSKLRRRHLSVSFSNEQEEHQYSPSKPTCVAAVPKNRKTTVTSSIKQDSRNHVMTYTSLKEAIRMGTVADVLLLLSRKCDNHQLHQAKNFTKALIKNTTTPTMDCSDLQRKHILLKIYINAFYIIQQSKFIEMKEVAEQEEKRILLLNSLNEILDWIQQWNKENYDASSVGKADSNDTAIKLTTDIKIPVVQLSLLHAAVYLRDLSTVQKVLQAGADPSVESKKVGTALALACDMVDRMAKEVGDWAIDQCKNLERIVGLLLSGHSNALK